MKKLLSRCAVVLATCCLLGDDASVVAACVGQSIEATGTIGVVLYANGEAGQTIACALGGTVESIEIPVVVVGMPSGMLVMGLYSTVSVDGSSIPDALLAERSMALAGIGAPDYVTMSFTGANLAVASGEALALVVRTTQPNYDPQNYIMWSGGSSVDYPDGMAYVHWLNPDWLPITDDNGAFVDLGLKLYLDCGTPLEASIWSAVKLLYR